MTNICDMKESNLSIDQSRLQRVLDMFVRGEPVDVLLTTFEGLYAELTNRIGAFKPVQGPNQNIQAYVKSSKSIAEAMSYASKRLQEVFFRLKCVDWMKDALAYEANPDVLARVSDPKAQS